MARDPRRRHGRGVGSDVRVRRRCHPHPWEGPMYASIRRYRLNSGSMADILHLVDTDFAETIQEVEGFVAYECGDSGSGELMTISVVRDLESAEASVALAADWTRDNLASRFDVTR